MYDSTNDTKQHIGRVQALLKSFESRLALRGVSHDYSKLHSPEKEMFDEVTPKLKGLTYGSPEYKASLKDLGVALLHHYKYNRHHPEHFCIVEVEDEHGTIREEVDKDLLASGHGIQLMSLMDIVEMLMDWKAASERHDNGDIMLSIEMNQERFGYSDEMKQILINTAVEYNWHDIKPFEGY